jgi:predicted O-methyltransferase YrrM
MNCIFITVFNEEKCINIFYLLLESIFIYGNLNDNTNILVYTSTLFMNIIKKSHLFNNDKIKFEINDTYNNIDKACRAKLDLFNLSAITNYNKILYLNTDIVKNDINILFDICQEDVLYVLEEGNIYDNFDNKTLFENEIDNYNNKSAFTSEILLFNNCEKIKNFFDNINEDIVKRSYQFNSYEQPYIVYNAFKYNLYNNKILKYFVINNDSNINSTNIIHHFSREYKSCQDKINVMSNFFNNIKDFTIINNINKTKSYIDKYLMPIIKEIGELLEGNIFMFHNTSTYTDEFLNKTKNITNLILNKNIKNVMEIGFGSGFSTLLMLLSNDNINITCLDLGEHKYTIPCYEKMKETFGERINIIIGDSTKTLKNITNTYDLIHIDGGHQIETSESDIINSYRLSKKGTIIIMDDYDFTTLHKLWDNYIFLYNLRPININTYDTPYHDIKYVISK